ncbi:MAG TPA: aldo/keto reductase [Ktedonobacteraceae bacterium]|jgi:aryl-alcohol dehydrogenase-like predicted oxidoreductase|nr:aldo/keto reductase [Ktedonobacteraceae bacterium]
MVTRQLGRSHVQVTPLCLGGNVFGRNIDEETAFAVLDTYVELGGNFIDTADLYTRGASEEVIGRWMKQRGNRAQIILATKLGKAMAPDKKGLSRTYMFEAVEDSLKRLQTDYIDLYQSHEDDLKTPLEETMEAFNELVKQGKVRVLGASNYKAERLAAANNVSQEHGYARYECLQPLYNLVERKEYEGELERVCREQEIGVIPFYALARGFLSGKYRPNQELPVSIRAEAIQKLFMNEYGFGVLAAVDQVAERHNVTATEVSLAWLMAHPGITAPIASATSPAQVRALMKAIELELTAEDIAVLTQAGD